MLQVGKNARLMIQKDCAVHFTAHTVSGLGSNPDSDTFLFHTIMLLKHRSFLSAEEF